MANILDKIFESKKEELAGTQREVPLAELKGRVRDQRPVKRLALTGGGEGSRIIAEIKRRTPLKGDLVEQFDPMKIAETYVRNGAAAISILTESKFFGGSLEYLSEASEKFDIPLLRKDFIFSEYQVYESRVFGADFFLLIATSLDKNQLKDLLLFLKFRISLRVFIHPLQFLQRRHQRFDHIFSAKLTEMPLPVGQGGCWTHEFLPFIDHAPL